MTAILKGYYLKVSLMLDNKNIIQSGKKVYLSIVDCWTNGMPDDALVLKTFTKWPTTSNNSPQISPSTSRSPSPSLLLPQNSTNINPNSQNNHQNFSVCLSIRSQCGWKEISSSNGELVFDLKVEVTGKSQRAPLFPLVFQLCEKTSQGLHAISEAIIVVKAITKIPKRPLRAHLASLTNDSAPRHHDAMALCASMGLDLQDKEEISELGLETPNETPESEIEDEDNDSPVEIFPENSSSPMMKTDIFSRGKSPSPPPLLPAINQNLLVSSPPSNRSFSPVGKDHFHSYIHTHPLSHQCGHSRLESNHILTTGQHRSHPYHPSPFLLSSSPRKRKIEPLDQLAFLSTLAALLPRTNSPVAPQH